MQMASELLRLQREQYTHDRRNHFDILSLSKMDRLKHYGLHFAKYVGRLARGVDESKSVERTLIDTFLVSLSAANTLHQELGSMPWNQTDAKKQIDIIYLFADAAGRFADACEKIDHMEEFVPQARQANADVIRLVLDFAFERNINLFSGACDRRKELAERQFYISD